MPKTFYLDNNFINVALRNTSFTPPTPIYVALFTTAPTAAGGGVEVTGGSYARQTATFVAPTNGQTSNSVDILFPIATANWGTIKAFALMDAGSGGNMLYFGNLSAERTVLTSDQVKFAAGQLGVQES
jgi:hypothetical protein